MAIRLDYTNMLAPAVAGGIPEEIWRGAQREFTRAREVVTHQRAAGVLGFLDLPRDASLREQSERFAAERRSGLDDVVVLGIGGSALGPIALRTALRAPLWNLRPPSARDGWPRLHVLDNVDPATMRAVLDLVDPRRTLFIVTSKSGGTAETMAQYLIVRAHLEHQIGASAVRDHLVFLTDPRVGVLRAIAAKEGIPALDIPSNVGGRFSVLSPVGLLPAALIGIDIRQVLDGAAAMADRCGAPDLGANPAGTFAVLQWAAQQGGRPIQVFMPYADALRDFAAWFVQLWAESLGKMRDGTGIGPTPIAALGATDQHSQVQLFMEGPQDKTVTFLRVEEGGADLPIPSLHRDLPGLAYLGGHPLGELLQVEQRATAGALALRGRPNMTLSLERIDPWHVGGLIMLLEIATIYGGALAGVDPLDQPGVELGKQLTYGMLGRSDITAPPDLARVPPPDRRHIL